MALNFLTGLSVSSLKRIFRAEGPVDFQVSSPLSEAVQVKPPWSILHCCSCSPLHAEYGVQVLYLIVSHGACKLHMLASGNGAAVGLPCIVVPMSGSFIIMPILQVAQFPCFPVARTEYGVVVSHLTDHIHRVMQSESRCFSVPGPPRVSHP